MQKGYKLNSFMQLIDQKIREVAFTEQYYYEDTYLKEYNQICPHCKGKVNKNLLGSLSVRNIVGSIALETQKIYVSYALCKECSKFLKTASEKEKKELHKLIKRNLISTLKI